jgi:predicted nucleic acid-binding protein
MIVGDATLYIALAKLRRLRLVQLLYGEIGMPPAVHSEVVEGGRLINAPEVNDIQGGLTEGWISVLRLSPTERSLADRILRTMPLGPGESECLAVASYRGLRLVVDDSQARAAARAMTVEHIGTAALLLEAHVREVLSYAELETALGELAETIWLSPAIVVEILKTAREVKG